MPLQKQHTSPAWQLLQIRLSVSHLADLYKFVICVVYCIDIYTSAAKPPASTIW
ncbi:hypothetical protein M422DRAFT_259659 [Sphaerobolus stellatus SS14]|uniref:Uncharacterized protein n=1 Tax=Sphaerobolus stellatus (strain SS14) TaxID=990650 RepID=A0A0C9UL87_SPHS4|nr:hypothetical protein M422DRAFT_269023 [Sphaerobolus stellatus SS14]KIJ37801.1 hypothetical protein M422DRAFT_259659 [Sphaerobolus stellatus SS14]